MQAFFEGSRKAVVVLGMGGTIAGEAQQYLNPEGRVLVEIGWRQGRAVADIFAAEGWAEIVILPDMDGRDRVIRAAKPG